MRLNIEFLVLGRKMRCRTHRAVPANSCRGAPSNFPPCRTPHIRVGMPSTAHSGDSLGHRNAGAPGNSTIQPAAACPAVEYRFRGPQLSRGTRIAVSASSSSWFWLWPDVTASFVAGRAGTFCSAGTAIVGRPESAGRKRHHPDPCTLFSDAEVTSLTGRDITQVDRTAPTQPPDPQQHRRLQARAGGLTLDSGNRRRPPTGATATSSCSSAGLSSTCTRAVASSSRTQAEAEMVAAALLPKVSSFS
jgi:hypothetical protein